MSVNRLANVDFGRDMLLRVSAGGGRRAPGMRVLPRALRIQSNPGTAGAEVYLLPLSPTSSPQRGIFMNVNRTMSVDAEPLCL
jgi:hypothetical protein